MPPRAGAVLIRPRDEDGNDDYLLRHLESGTRPDVFCLDVAGRCPDDAEFIRVLYVLLVLVGDQNETRALGHAARSVLTDTVAYAALVTTAAIMGHPEAYQAACLLAWACRGPEAAPLEHLRTPRESPAMICATAAFAALETLGRAAALDARATREPAVARYEEALAQHMANYVDAPRGTPSETHYRSLQQLCTPRAFAYICEAMLARKQSIITFQVRVPPDLRRALACIFDDDARDMYDLYSTYRGGRTDGWRAALRAQLPVAHAALVLVSSDERAFARTTVRLHGDAAWPVANPVTLPTLVILGQRFYVLKQDRVVRFDGPGTAFAAWRAELRGALRFSEVHTDRFSDSFGNSFP